MADLKISQLTGASTPLAGTEVLPIVQSGSTVKVSVANLTAGRAVSAASVTASTGNFVVGTAGQGIDFSATAGTGTSELLNDYEEGTWTPTIAGSSTAGTGTYTSQLGTYVKVGRQVTLQFNIAWTAHTGTGNMQIKDLPFTNGSLGLQVGGIIYDFSSLTLPALNLLSVFIANASATMGVLAMPTGGGSTTFVAMDASAGIYGAITYFV